MKRLGFKQILSVSMMLFAIFFGAGNMIFPPAMGQLAGTNFLPALAGFILTDAGIAILGITAVVLIGNSMSDLGMLISKRFAIILSVGVYLLIGPLFALPRTGSVSFELAILPYISNHQMVSSILFTGVFFIITYYLSSNPNKIVNVVGKYLTPVLLISIVLIFIAALTGLNLGDTTLTFGTMNTADVAYQSNAFFKGMMEGYNALDGPAGLAFSIIVISAIRGYGITDKKAIAKYTILSGLGAAAFLSIVYFMLTYIGAITNTSFANGGALLHAVSNHLFGGVGGIILGIAVLLACLTTSIGLTTSFSDYFHDILPSIGYKKIAAGVCFFSFVISNVGLSQLIAISLPILIMVYPVTVVLIILSFMRSYIGHHKAVYICSLVFTGIVSCLDGLTNAGISIGFLHQAANYIPFFDIGIGWIIPAVLGGLIGYLVPIRRNNTTINVS